MKQLKLPLMLFAGLILCCSQQENRTEEIAPDTPSALSPIIPRIPIKINTDTLQFIHFDGNGDYWNAYFLNSHQDTIRLVADQEFSEHMLDKLMKVQWKTDTLFSAGEGEAEYTDKRLIGFSKIKGKPFSAALSEQQAIAMLRELPEIKGTVEKVWTDQRPSFDKPYYELGTSMVEDGTAHLFLYFRIYTFPNRSITVFDKASGSEMDLEGWRQQNNK